MAVDSTDGAPGDPDRLEFTLELRECGECRRQVVALGPDRSRHCHGEPLQPVGEPRTVPLAALADWFDEEFDVPGAGVELCGHLLATELRDATRLADVIGAERGTVLSRLDRLVAAGLLERVSLPREDGGTVGVYHVPNEGAGTPDTLAELQLWATAAVANAATLVTRGTVAEATFATSFRAAFSEESAGESRGPRSTGET